MENSPGSIRVVTISMHAEIILQLLTESPNHSLPCYDITHFRDGDIIVKRCWGNYLNELMIITTFMSRKGRALKLQNLQFVMGTLQLNHGISHG